MPVPFGISVGDFVAGLSLITNALKKIQDEHGAKANYQSLIREVANLQAGFIAIEDFVIGTTNSKRHAAIQQAVAEGRDCIEDFLLCISKYQPSLDVEGTTSGWKAKLCQIRWGICKKEGVAKFRTDLQQRSWAVNMLLVTLQLYNLSV